MGTLLNFTDVGTASSHGRAGGTFLIRVEEELYRRSGIVFQCILNEDVDGAPHCYARFNPANPNGKNGGLDVLPNATSNENATFNAAGNSWSWVGVVSRTQADAAAQHVDIDNRPELGDGTRNAHNQPAPRFPVFQPGKHFYVSRTATVASAASDTDQSRYWDATAVSYGAITPPLKRIGVELGDFGLAIRNDTGVSEPFFYADAGGQEKVGEMSTHLFRRLFPGNDQEGHPVTFIVFPGSGSNPPKAANQDGEIQTRLWTFSQADNISELIDVMALGACYDIFRATGTFFISSSTRQNILNALIKAGHWHFYSDRPYTIGPPGKTPASVKWVEWAKRRGVKWSETFK
jgi:hypothetical protein